MAYKVSKFNLVTEYDGKTLLFNSLKNTFSAIKGFKKTTFEDLCSLTNEQVDLLNQQGILVDEEVDEDKLAYIKYVELIHSKVLHLIIMPTMSCNFRCSYCYEDKIAGKMNQETMDAIVRCVQKNIEDVKGINVSWFGGEPLLCMDIIEEISQRIMKIAKYYKISYFADITTNGYYLNEETIRKLLRCNVVNYQVTIDGNEEIHNKTRPHANGEKTFQTIMTNLKNIRDQVRSRLFTIVIRNNMTIDSLQDMDSFVDQLCKEFGEDDRFSFMFRRVGNWGGESVKGILDKIIKDEDILLEKLLTYDGKLYLSKQFSHFEKYPFCYAACDKNFVFGPNGEVQKCTVDLKNKDNLVGKLDASGNMNLNDKHSKWIYCMADHQIQEKCKECKLFANCFANVCPLVLINKDMYNPSQCVNLDKELQVLYKMRSDKFTELVLA